MINCSSMAKKFKNRHNCYFSNCIKHIIKIFTHFPTEDYLNYHGFGISCNMLAVEWYKGLCVNSLTNFGKTYGLVRWSLADKGTWRSLVRWSTWRWRHKRWAVRTHWYLHTPDPLGPSSREDMHTGSCRWCWCTQRSDHTVTIHTRRCLRGIRLP